jgi:hypothetical protein
MNKTVEIIETEINHIMYVLKFKINPEHLYSVEVEAYTVTGEVLRENFVDYDPPKKTYERVGATSSNDTTYSLEDAKRTFEGWIKWDGCSDIQFFPDEMGNNHFCGKASAVNLGLLVSEAYDHAATFMGDKVDEGCFYD